MRIDKPDADLAGLLDHIGVPGLENIELEDQDLAKELAHICDQHNKGLFLEAHSEKQLADRAIARCCWQKYGLPELKSGARAQAIEDAKSREVSNVHTLLRQWVAADIPALISHSAGEILASASDVKAELKVSREDLRTELSISREELRVDLGKLGVGITDAVGRLTSGSGEQIQNLRKEVTATLGELASETATGSRETVSSVDRMSNRIESIQTSFSISAAKWLKRFFWMAAGYGAGIILLLAALLFFSVKAHAQVDCVGFYNSGGAMVRNYCAPFRMKEGTGITFSASGNTLTITASSGAGTVTSFSAGTLSPLFTTSVATATTTPALSFTLSNAAALTLFGNNTGGAAAPAFFAPLTTRGDILVLNSSTVFGRVALGSATAGKYLKSDGTDAVVSTGSASGTGACGASQWASTLNADAAPSCTQPAFSNLSGSATIAQLPTSVGKGTWGIVLDGGGSAITTGVKGETQIPYTCTITEWTILLDQSGSIVIDIWKDTYANYPPTVADTITAAAKPTVTTATNNTSTTLSGWTTSVTAGDTVRFNVDSITTATRATLLVYCTKG